MGLSAVGDVVIYTSAAVQRPCLLKSIASLVLQAHSQFQGSYAV